MAIKDRLKEIFSNDPEFTQYAPEDQELILEEVSRSKSSIDEFLAQDDEFNQYDEASKQEVKQFIAPDFFGAPLDTPEGQMYGPRQKFQVQEYIGPAQMPRPTEMIGPVPGASVTQEVPQPSVTENDLMSGEQADALNAMLNQPAPDPMRPTLSMYEPTYIGPAGAEAKQYEPTYIGPAGAEAKQYEPSEKISQAAFPSLQADKPLENGPISNVATELKANLVKKIAGTAQAVANTMDVPMFESLYTRNLASLRKEADEELQKVYQAKGQMTLTERLVHDTVVGIFDSVPAMLGSIYTGTALPSIAYSMAGAFGNKYSQMQDAGYSNRESLTRAGVSAIGPGITAAVTVGNALNLTKPLVKQFITGAVVESVGGGANTAAEFVADAITQKFFSDGEKQLLDPNMEFTDYLKEIAMSAATEGLANVFTTQMPRAWSAAKLWAQDLKAIDVQGEAVIVPRQDADFYKDIADKANLTAADVQKGVVADAMDQTLREAAAQREALIERQITEKPLDYKSPAPDMNLDEQRGPTPYKGKLETGAEVALSPKFLEGKTSEVLNTELPAKVVSQKVVDGVATVELQLENGQVYKDVPVDMVVNRSRLGYTRNANAPESRHMINLIRSLIKAPADFSDMDPNQARSAFGSILGVVEKGIRGELAGVDLKKTGYGRIVWDAMANHPDMLPRILSHEPGHIIMDITPEAAKNLGMEGFMPFRTFIEELGQRTFKDLPEETKKAFYANRAKAPDMQESDSDFAVRTQYGDDLQQMWKGWALYPEAGPKFNPDTQMWEGGNVRELMANALSLIITDAVDPTYTIPAGKTSVDMQVDYKNTKLYQDWLNYLDNNPEMKASIGIMRAAAMEAGSPLDQAAAAFEAADVAKGQARAAKGFKATLQGLMEGGTAETLRNYLFDSFDSLLEAGKRNPKALEQMGRFLGASIGDASYVRETLQPTYEWAIKNKVNPNHISVFLTANRVIKDRARLVRILKGDSTADSMDALKQQTEIQLDNYRQHLLGDEPDIEPARLEKMINDRRTDLLNDESWVKQVKLLNPGGMTEADAYARLKEIKDRYGEEVYSGFEDVQKRQRASFNENILPVLEASGQFTPNTIAMLRDNADYVTFDVIHHSAGDIAKDGTPKYGSIGHLHKQQGTLSDISDPLAATVDKALRMRVSAEKAALFRDLITDAADMDNPIDPKNAYQVVRGEDGKFPDVKKGWKIVETKAYDKETGKVESTHFAVREAHLLGFEKPLFADSGVLKYISGVNAQFKTWLTIFDPGFWATNWLRDTFKTMIGLPGVASLPYIPPVAVIEGARDLYLRARGRENPLRTQLEAERVLVGGMMQTEADAWTRPMDQYLAMSSLDPDKYRAAYGPAGSIFDRLHVEATRGVQAIKGFASFIGESVEFSTKAAGYKYLETFYGDMPREQKNNLLRNAVGTPMLARKGYLAPLLQNVFMFYNPNIQGLMSDFNAHDKSIMQGLKSKEFQERILKRVVLLAPMQMAIQAGLNGLMGQEMQEMLEKIPLYAWLRGCVIPIGTTSTGDTAYGTLPMDQLTKWVNGMMFVSGLKINEATGASQEIFKMFNKGQEAPEMKTIPGMDALMTIGTNFDDALPSISPVVSMIKDAGDTFLTKTGPVDFLNRPVVPPEIMGSEDTLEKAKYLMAHAYRSNYFAPLLKMGGFPLLADIAGASRAIVKLPAFGNGEKPKSAQEQKKLNNQIATFLTGVVSPLGTSAPAIAPLARFIHTSSAGVQQWANYRNDSVNRQIQSGKNSAERDVNNRTDAGLIELAEAVKNNPKSLAAAYALEAHIKRRETLTGRKAEAQAVADGNVELVPYFKGLDSARNDEEKQYWLDRIANHSSMKRK